MIKAIVSFFKKLFSSSKEKSKEDSMSVNEKAFRTAEFEIGQTEWAGSAANPRIVEYGKSVDLKPTSDEVPWCSIFVNYCFQKAGNPGTKDAMARSWLNWGVPVKTPELFDVVVFERGNNGYSGHVGFVAKVPAQGDVLILVLGGNQDNQVKYKKYPRSAVLGFRRAV